MGLFSFTVQGYLKGGKKGLAIVNRGGFDILEFDLAVPEKKGTAYYHFKAFGKTGQFIMQHFKEGDPIICSGDMEQEQWESEGRTNRKDVGLVSKVNFLLRQGSMNGSASRDPGVRTSYDERPARDERPHAHRESDFPDDIPF